MTEESLLVAGIRRGDVAALAAIYERHSTHVRGLACRLGGAHRADDVVHDVFLALWRDPDALVDGGSLAEHLAHLTHMHAGDCLPSERGLLDDDDRAEALASRLGGEAWAVLSELPVPLRDAIALAHFAGYSFREMSVVLDRLDGALRSGLREGLDRIRSDIADAP